MKKRLWVGGAIVLVGAIGLLLTRGRPVEVLVAEARRDTLSVTIPAEGRTRARDRFTVTAPVSGRLTRLQLDEGQMVEEGQRLARLFPAPQDPRVIATFRAEVGAAEARYREAESYVHEAEAQAEQAAREVERRRPLADMGAIARERMEQAELAALVAEQRRESAAAALASAQAALDAARARLLGAESTDEGVQAIDIVAPVSGRVLRVPDESERVVAAGSPLVELGGTGGLEVVLDILSEDAVRVEPGQPIVISGWGGDHPLMGEVRTVTLVGHTRVSALGVEEQRVDVVGDLHSVPATLGTGYRVSGEIVVWHSSDALSVPTSALFRVGEGWQVFAVDARGRAERRDVVIGRRNESAAEIVEGVAEGERVVLFPPEEVEEGTSVRAAG